MQYLKQRHYKLDWKGHLVFSKDKVIRKQYVLFITVQHKQPKSLLSSMMFIIPFEVPFDIELNF